MQAKTKSGLILGSTLLIGALLGALGQKFGIVGISRSQRILQRLGIGRNAGKGNPGEQKQKKVKDSHRSYPLVFEA